MTPVEIMFSTSLVAVPALSRVEPATISGPGVWRDGELHRAAQLGVWRATDAGGDSAHLPGGANGPST
jgi:hypothetical protein